MKEEIHLDGDNFEQSSELYRRFENLYLGPSSTYRLYFHVERLQVIHDLFDKIIREHGLRDVNFDFEIDGYVPLEVEA